MKDGKKVILVTGANKGIGLEMVRQLSRLGHTVILSSRNEQRGKEAKDKLDDEKLNTHFVLLDMDEEESIREAVVRIKEQFGSIDVLINNAAILQKQDQSLLKSDWNTLEQTIQTNALAQLKLVRHMIPLLIRGGRILMASSGGGSMTDPVGGWSPAYCISKSLLNAITRHLAYELESKSIAVNAYCPGWVQTDMGGKSAPRKVAQGADTAVWLATANTIPTGKFFRDRKEIPW